jgi:DNA (cytosine-5)-methyltransferase 1
MRYLSVCSGIEAATTAWHELGWEPVAFSEIEPFPSAVLKHHYPDVPNLGDMTKFKEWDIGTIDLLVGGTPCQSFSVAGLRKGLEDPRGNLALTYVGILDKFRPKWFIWENVPGVLSSGSGRDFGSFLGALGQIGYGFAYRVLDAQYFGVAQRRRRVFVVGCLGDWRNAAEVLFEPESLRGDPAPSREKGQKVAPAVSTGAPFSRTGNERVECDAIVPTFVPSVANCLETTSHDYSRADGFNMIAKPIPIHDQATRFAGKRGENQDGKGNGLGIGQPGDPMNTLTKGDRHAVAQPIAFTTEQTPKFNENQALTLTKSEAKHNQSVLTEMAVRRLTPIECERLQGFPDNYTNIPWRKAAESPDGPRYKSLGNSMAVPVMKWIGKRIANAS